MAPHTNQGDGNNLAATKPGKHVPPPAATVHRVALVHWAHWGVSNAAHFVYDESSRRSEMFHRKPGDVTTPIHADCSQFYASLCHWVGIGKTNDRDYTGTLLEKGEPVDLAHAQPGDCVIWGPGTGTHAAMLTEKSGSDWWTIGFGHQGAPDRVLLSALNAYFAQTGHPGVRILDFTG